MPLPRRALAYDLVYCLADLSPAWGRIPTIVALRNFNIYDRRFYDGPRTRLLLRLVQMGARRARGIVCPTRAAANSIAPVVGVDPERFSIVHHGIAPEAFLGASAADRTEARYLFYPAALERHAAATNTWEGCAADWAGHVTCPPLEHAPRTSSTKRTLPYGEKVRLSSVRCINSAGVFSRSNGRLRFHFS